MKNTKSKSVLASALVVCLIFAAEMNLAFAGTAVSASAWVEDSTKTNRNAFSVGETVYIYWNDAPPGSTVDISVTDNGGTVLQSWPNQPETANGTLSYTFVTPGYYYVNCGSIAFATILVIPGTAVSASVWVEDSAKVYRNAFNVGETMYIYWNENPPGSTVDISVTDNGGTVLASWTDQPESANGTLTYTFTALGYYFVNCGSIAFATVIVMGAHALSITAPDDIAVEGNTVGGATGVALGTATALGGTAPYTISNDAPTTFPLGSTTVTWTVTDAADSTATDTQLVIVQDTTPPTITAPDTLSVFVSAPKSVLTGSVADIVDPNPTLTNDAPAVFPPGTTSVTWTATDASGNKATKKTMVTATYYSFIGFLQPINMDGSSMFKAGSSVPVKFQMKDHNGAFVSSAVASITYAKVTNGIVGTEVEAISTSKSTTGNLFRYDLTSNQYIFNLSTKELAKGTYQFKAILDDGTSRTVLVSLK